MSPSFDKGRKFCPTARRIGVLLATGALAAVVAGCGASRDAYDNGAGSSGAYPGGPVEVAEIIPPSETAAFRNEKSAAPARSPAPAPASAPAPSPGPVVASAGVRTHRVSKGDTLYNISKRYGVEVADIRASNNMGGSNALDVGDVLRIPGGASGGVPRSANAGIGRNQTTNPFEAAQRANQAAAALGPRRLQRPVPGEIVRAYGEGFGRRKNAGVDLGAEPGAQVVAAADGKVAFVSDPTSPVGAVVLMEHPGGMTTIYGRLTQISVRPGQQLRAGQAIARVAPRSGDRAALHFEVRYGSEPVNPTPFL